MFDEEKKLWKTEIGIGKLDGPLLCTLWGNTEHQSRERARVHYDLLNKVMEADGLLKVIIK